MGVLYTVLLSKNLDSKDEHRTGEWINEHYTRWVSLGHFDDIYVYSDTSDKGLLDKIKKSKGDVFLHNDGQVYYHPLHLVPKDNNSSFTNNDEYRFIAIVRIHFPNSTSFTQEFKDLSDRLASKFDSSSLSYQTFYATELSDMVVDIRSNRLDLLTEAVFNLYKKDDDVNKHVNFGKTYTYFGINYNYLKSNKLPNNHDKLQMFTIRFSRQDEVTEKQIKLISNTIRATKGKVQKYRINGIDDIMLICSECHTRALVDIYRNLLFNDEYKNFQKSESSSRMGITFNFESFYGAKLNTDLKNSKMCKDLPELCNCIANYLESYNTEEHFGWFHTVSEIANSLVRMSSTPVMDEVVYLLAPAVHAFLVDIKENLSKGYDWCYDSLYDYAEACSYYIEQLMRIEGQLSHNPEIRPVIYNIPLFMIEYTIAFLNKVSKLLVHNDVNNGHQTKFLLVPKPCELIGASELFSAGTNPYGLVYIQIPERMLYQPKELFQILCHEISHYVGERYRNRDFRKSAYARAAASLMIGCVFNTDERFLLDFIEDKYFDAINKIEKPTIREMSAKVCEITENLLTEEDSLNKFVLDYFSYVSKKKCSPINLRDFSKEYIGILVDEFQRDIVDLDTLFREIYADICMMYMLNINPDEYIQSLLKELSLNHKEGDYSCEMFAIRIYVTLHSLGYAYIKYDGFQYITMWESVKIFINQIREEIDRGELDGECEDEIVLHIPITSIYELMEYSKKCYNDISSSFLNDDINDVRNMFLNLSDKERFTLKNILEEIQLCRSDILKTYTTSNDGNS